MSELHVFPLQLISHARSFLGNLLLSRLTILFQNLIIHTLRQTLLCVIKYVLLDYNSSTMEKSVFFSGAFRDLNFIVHGFIKRAIYCSHKLHEIIQK